MVWTFSKIVEGRSRSMTSCRVLSLCVFAVLEASLIRLQDTSL